MTTNHFRLRMLLALIVARRDGEGIAACGSDDEDSE